MSQPEEPLDRPEDWLDTDDDTPPYWFPGQHLPPDARRLGLDHTVPAGALLDFAGALDPTKPMHRATAWVMLAVLSAPAALHLLRLLRGLSS